MRGAIILLAKCEVLEGFRVPRVEADVDLLEKELNLFGHSHPGTGILSPELCVNLTCRSLTDAGHNLRVDQVGYNYLDSAWTAPGQIMDRAWTDHGQRLDRSWTAPGQIMDSVWTDHGQRLDRSWTASGQIMDSVWTDHRQRLDISWTVSGQIMDSAWTDICTK